jgi:hypothetical protein
MSGGPRHSGAPDGAEGPGTEHRHCSPPSAGGHLEPSGVRLRLQPQTHPLETVPFLTVLLEQIAASCLEAGASLIGHLKCVLRTTAGPLFCNLTSVRAGASCRGGGAKTVAPGTEAELDLAVLVYGLPAEVAGRLVGEALDGLLAPLEVLVD